MTECGRRCPAAARSAWLVALLAASLAIVVSVPAAEPVSAWDAFRRGERLAGDGDLAGALRAYEEARSSIAGAPSLDRSLAEALTVNLYNLAASLTSAGETDLSLRSIEQIYSLRKIAGKIRDASLERTIRSGAERLADYAVSAGKAASALPMYQAMVDFEPADAGLKVRLSAALLAAGDPDKAKAVAEEVRKIEPRSAESRALTARADLMASKRLTSRGEHREARLRTEWAAQDLLDALQIERDSVPRLAEYASALSALARLLDEEGDHPGGDAARARALGALDEAAGLSPDQGGIWMERGRLLEIEGRHAEASAAFEKAAGLFERAGGDSALRLAPEARKAEAAGVLMMMADAVNEARFDEASSVLERVRRLDPALSRAADALRDALREAEEQSRLVRGENERILAAHPGRGDSLLALGDLDFLYGRYESARSFYDKLARAAEEKPPEAVIRGRLFRTAGVAASEPARKLEFDAGGLRLEVRYAVDEGLGEARKGLVAAWRRVAAALGPFPEGALPLVKIYANQRAFRTSAGPHIGATATGSYGRGTVSVFVEPGRGTAAWATVLGREIAAWACDRIGRGRAPRWVREGVSRRAAGEPGRPDRARLARAADAGGWIPAVSLDLAFAMAWNDGRRLSLLEEESMLLMATLESAKGLAAARSLLEAFASGAGVPADEAFNICCGIGLGALDAAARASLPASPPS